ncbi:MAG: hypothetical protein LBP43_01810 [Treponema sp.]|jgi:hypothetical protein|nr:hypothetical protein [Treponema sp.]
MRKEQCIVLFDILFLLSGGLFAVGEKVLSIGAGSTWQGVEIREGIAEISAVRPYPVLALSSSRLDGTRVPGTKVPGTDASLPDLVLTFDEASAALFTDQAGHYQVAVSETALAAGSLSAADPSLARAGTGAAFFSRAGGGEALPQGFGIPGPLTLTPREDALLAPGRIIRDFSIEFWLYPLNVENGEEILSWTALKEVPGDYTFQRIQCVVSKNRLQWTFTDFFSLPGENRTILLSLGALSPVLPRSWSHHLIRFDSATGLLEYQINGRLEGVTYATSSNREGGAVYTPLAGVEGSLILGGRFTGLLDEVRIHRRFLEETVLAKYPAGGGWMETRFLDLGEGQNTVLRVDASGGRVSGNAPGLTLNEYTENGSFRFADESALQFFIRTTDSLYRAPGEWQSFIPGREISGGLKGRFIQLAAAFYPSGDGETTPYLEELRVLYQPDLPPLPPAMVNAVPRDGGADLSWRGSPDTDVTGYLVYYGLSPGEYFCDHAILGVSPIDVGKRNSIRIDGLRNGTLYYFAVAAYDRAVPIRPGMFSREVTARPLRMIE